MNRRVVASALLTVLFLFGAIGCQNSPGNIISPSSDVHVASINPSVLQPKEEESSSSDSSSTGPTVPLLQVFFQITNGISTFINSYSVRYVTTTGASLAGGRFDHSGALALHLKAPGINTPWDIGLGTGAGTSTGGQTTGGTTGGTSGTDVQQTIPGNIAGFVSMDVMTSPVYNYMTRGTTSYGDDVTPVIAQVRLNGRDINDREVGIDFQVTLQTTILVSSSGN